MPWKVLGRKWHLSRKGFPSNKRVHWETAVLERLLDVFDDALKNCEVDWSNKVLINYVQPGEKNPVVSVQTKRREGIFVTILTPPGRIALGQIATLGAEREITTHRSGQEAVKVMFDDLEQVDGKAIRELLRQVMP
jgi:excinuclease ABC subunit A